jgi:hypothetical protein
MPGFPDKFTPFYKRPPGSRISSTMSRLVGSFVRPLRRISERERNRELRWTDHVPSGWAMDLKTPTMTHRFLEFFYERLQYFASERPGRQKDVEKYRSGYVTPAERAYGDEYQSLPAHRAKVARKRGVPQRRGLSPQADGFEIAPESPDDARRRHTTGTRRR